MAQLKSIRVGTPLFRSTTVTQNIVSPTSLDSLSDVSFNSDSLNHGDIVSYDSNLGQFTATSTLLVQNISGGQY